MRPALRAMIAVDGLVARTTVPLTERQNILVPLLFHSLVEHESELQSGYIHPDFAVTTAEFRETIVELQGAGYTFLKPADLDDPTRCTTGRYALLTLDDGYANQMRALPVLQELGVPAVFFISTGYVGSGRSFWWDVVYRELRRTGADSPAVAAALSMYRLKPRASIERALCDLYGADCVTARGEIDRPLTMQELREMASSSYVTLANHTVDHNVVTQLDDRGLADELNRSQNALSAISGARPNMFAYPDGVVDRRLDQIGSQVGIRWAFTSHPQASKLPFQSPAYAVGRYSITRRLSPRAQVLSLRSRWSLQRLYRRHAMSRSHARAGA